MAASRPRLDVASASTTSLRALPPQSLRSIVSYHSPIEREASYTLGAAPHSPFLSATLVYKSPGPVAEVMKSFNVAQAILVAGCSIVVYLWLCRRFARSQSAIQLRAKHRSLEQIPARDEATQSSKQRRGIHLRHVNPPGEGSSETETDIDIIAIHGLDTKSPDTWIYKSEKPDQPGVNWLVDKNMLPSRVGHARIFTCDWPADLFERSDLVQKTIEEFARLLLAGIKRQRLAMNDHERETRPILFIASCLGGIILIKALCLANGEYIPIKTATRGVIFLATPFRGTSFQDVANWAEPGLRAWASVRGQKVTKLLDSVKGSTFNLDELVRQFCRLCRDQALTNKIMIFYEKGETDLYHKVFPWLSIPFHQKKVVRITKQLPF